MISGSFLTRHCIDCGEEYYVSLAALILDDGRCIQCLKDIWILESLYELEDKR